jgi:hypothetical protein
MSREEGLLIEVSRAGIGPAHFQVLLDRVDGRLPDGRGALLLGYVVEMSCVSTMLQSVDYC